MLSRTHLALGKHYFLLRRLENFIVRNGSSSKGGQLKSIIKSKIPIWFNTIKELRKEHGNTEIGTIKVNQIYTGMRGMYGMIWETSDLDPQEGICFRGLTIEQVRFALPKPDGAKEPYIEGFLWFLLTGQIPTKNQTEEFASELASRYKLPDEVVKMIDCADKCWHPMSMLSLAADCMSNYSKFNASLKKGIKKADYWLDTYEDGMDLIAKFFHVAGLIYRKKHMDNNRDYQWSEKGDLAKNFGIMIGNCDDHFIDFVRTYMILHSDHEGGNVSAHAMHLIGSALSDVYKSYSGAMCGLAGPLHGLATQTTLEWLLKMQEKYGENPTAENIKSFVDETLKAGGVIPGYGHAVLRKTDPRFTAQLNFSKEHKIETPLVKLVAECSRVIPDLLLKGGKVQNPFPNVDAHSGALLKNFNINDYEFYTVMFGISRAIGTVANTIWTRALGAPIERPKSISTCKLRALLNEKKKSKKDCK